MKKLLHSLFFSIFTLSVFTSCVSAYMEEYTEDENLIYDSKEDAFKTQINTKNYWTGQDSNIEIFATSIGNTWIKIIFKNLTDETIILDNNTLTFYNGTKGENYHLIPEFSKGITSELMRKDTLIPAKGIISTNYTAQEKVVEFDKNPDDMEIYNWIPEVQSSSIIISYKKESSDKSLYLKLDGKIDVDIQTPTVKNYETLGTVETSKFIPHILFISPRTKNRRQMYEKALSKAREQYGKDIELKNLEYDSSWSVFSLILYWDAFVFFEKAKLNADVVSKPVN